MTPSAAPDVGAATSRSKSSESRMPCSIVAFAASWFPRLVALLIIGKTMKVIEMMSW